MNEKKTVTVSILGRSYSLVTDEKGAIIEDAAKMVDSLMKRVIDPSTSPSEVPKKVTFVALQLAVDLLKKSAEYDVIGDKISTLNTLLHESH
jgi:cell division protein ZapA (FtsZ GTPase activity inhibitor)